MNQSTTRYVLILAVSLLGACSKDSGNTQSAAAASEGDEASPQETRRNATETMTGGQDLQVLATVDGAEIDQGQLAVSKASSGRVRDFANAMIEQHTQARQDGAQFAAQNNITLTPSKLSNELQTDAAETLGKLQKSDPAKFDEMYMKAQVDQHRTVLKKLDDELIPNAPDSAAREQLVKARSLVQHHLTQAEQIQSTLTH
jgi:putative membrane protein